TSTLIAQHRWSIRHRQQEADRCLASVRFAVRDYWLPFRLKKRCPIKYVSRLGPTTRHFAAHRRRRQQFDFGGHCQQSSPPRAKNKCWEEYGAAGLWDRGCVPAAQSSTRLDLNDNTRRSIHTVLTSNEYSVTRKAEALGLASRFLRA